MTATLVLRLFIGRKIQGSPATVFSAAKRQNQPENVIKATQYLRSKGKTNLQDWIDFPASTGNF